MIAASILYIARAEVNLNPDKINLSLRVGLLGIAASSLVAAGLLSRIGERQTNFETLALRD